MRRAYHLRGDLSAMSRNPEISSSAGMHAGTEGYSLKEHYINDLNES